MDGQDKLSTVEQMIYTSTAYNSYLYQFIADRANLNEIAVFLNWDGHQPAFYKFLSWWRDLVPQYLKPQLIDHIAEEVDGRHSELFINMLAYINKITGTSEVTYNEEQLKNLNFTFDAICAETQDFGFFIGSFFATEIMSAKRCAQVLQGLDRLKVDRRQLEYLIIHVEADSNHGKEVKEKFLIPTLQNNPEKFLSIVKGVTDRVYRSGAYLHWYEQTYLLATKNQQKSA